MDADGFSVFLARIAATPLLTPAAELELARRVERGDEAARRHMTEANLRLVVHVARRFPRDGHGLALPDLVQEGTIGLLRAVERFDHRRGHRFSTYAVIWIRQAIARAIAERGRDIRLPAHARGRLRTLDRAAARLRAEHGREPTTDELGEALGWLPEAVLEARELRRTTVSLDAPADGADAAGLGALLPADGAEAPPAQAEAAEERAAVRAALRALDARERAVLSARFGLDADAESVAETARRLGLRPRDVRRLETLALRKLRAAPGADALAA
jgi:RNA polymerase primary sigma factor